VRVVRGVFVVLLHERVLVQLAQERAHAVVHEELLIFMYPNAQKLRSEKDERVSAETTKKKREERKNERVAVDHDRIARTNFQAHA